MTLLTAGSAAATPYVYEYIGGAPGYGGELILDASSGTSGTVADILGGYVETPTFGVQKLNPANTRHTLGPALQWNASEITGMSFIWQNSDVKSRIFANSGGSYGFISSFGLSAPYNNDYSNNGQWLAAVPDTGNTLILGLMSSFGLIAIRARIDKGLLRVRGNKKQDAVRFAVATLLLLAMSALSARAQGTAFSYQGKLNGGSAAANGLYDFRFSMSNAALNGTAIGSPITQTGIGVTNGLFNTVLDFGPLFTGNATWLAISVRTNGVGFYTPLTPLQPITTVPYAVYAANAGNAANAANASMAASVPATGVTGQIGLSQLPVAAVTNTQNGVTLNGSFSGTFNGDGSGLYNTPTANNYAHGYDNATHTSISSFQNIFLGAANVYGWTYDNGAGVFVCPVGGMYLVHYTAEVGTTTSAATTISVRVWNYGLNYEVPGSAVSLTTSVPNQAMPASQSFLTYFAAGNSIGFQFSANNLGGRLMGGVGAAIAQPSFTCTIVRIQ